MTSIRRALLAGLLSGLLAVVLVAATIIYTNAREEANRLFDSQLQQVAESFPSYALSAQPAPPLREFVAEGRLVIQVWTRDPFASAFSSSILAPPRQAEGGFMTVNVRGGSWRVYTRVGDFDVVQVAQPMSVRSRQAAAVALSDGVASRCCCCRCWVCWCGWWWAAGWIRCGASRSRCRGARRTRCSRSASTVCPRRCSR